MLRSYPRGGRARRRRPTFRPRHNGTTSVVKADAPTAVTDRNCPPQRALTSASDSPASRRGTPARWQGTRRGRRSPSQGRNPVTLAPARASSRAAGVAADQDVARARSKNHHEDGVGCHQRRLHRAPVSRSGSLRCPDDSGDATCRCDQALMSIRPLDPVANAHLALDDF
jgi:hypothetical protein